MRGVPLGEIVRFLDDVLDVTSAADYPNALNGLQVEASGPVERVAVAVDASEAVIGSASEWADLLIVHHGLFWGGLQPLTGPHFRRIKALIESGTALYSVHLPLDSHPELGNCAVLARALGLVSLAPFGEYGGAPVGWWGRPGLPEIAPSTASGGSTTPEAGDENAADAALAAATQPLEALTDRLAEVLGGEVKTLPGGPDEVASVAVVTGAGASTLAEAAALGIDVLVTGEAQHHHAIEAAELGVTVLLGGHYATETWGVKKVAELLRDRFGIEGRFVDSPTGL